jgi:hypothetical protein
MPSQMAARMPAALPSTIIEISLIGSGCSESLCESRIIGLPQLVPKLGTVDLARDGFPGKAGDDCAEPRKPALCPASGKRGKLGIETLLQIDFTVLSALCAG